jgi:hypothetical protein
MSDFSKFPYKQNLHFARKSGVFVTKCQQKGGPLRWPKKWGKFFENFGKNWKKFAANNIFA